MNEAEYIDDNNTDNLVDNFDFEDISVEEFLLSDEMDDIVLTDVTTGQTNKTAPLVTLTDSHFKIILSPTGWLDCDIIHQVYILLSSINPSIEGFQRPTLGPVRNFDIVGGEFIQILHTGNYHWVCVSSIGCLPGKVNLYDSLFHNIIEDEVEQQVKSLMGEDLFKDTTIVPVQQQNNGSDCGVLAAAFATCLVNYIPPETVQFDFPKMRQHLFDCLKTGVMQLFPTI